MEILWTTKAFAGMWLCLSFFLAWRGWRKTADSPKVAEEKDLKELDEFLEMVEGEEGDFSPATLRAFFISTLLILLAIDFAGFLMAYEYVPFHPVKYAAFFLAILLVVVDIWFDIRFLRKFLKTIHSSLFKEDLKMLFLARGREERSLLANAMRSGKALVALHLYLWTMH